MLDSETLQLLKKIVGKSNILGTEPATISIYSLIDEEKKQKEDSEEAIENTIAHVYYLAGLGLIEVATIKGDDGIETVVKPTERGKSFIKYEPKEKDIE